MIIKISLNGSDPLNFIFDSGAGATLLTKSVADSLGLNAKFYRNNIGVSGSHKVGVNKGVRLTLGDFEVGSINVLSSNTFFEELDNGEKVYGVIGYAILSEYVVKVDNERSEIILYNRNNFKYDGSGYELPIKLEQNLPLVHANVELFNGTLFEGHFMIDTGSRTDIIMSSPAVRKYAMAENVGKYYTLRTTIGTSNRRSKIRYGRLRLFQLADFSFENLPVALSSDNKGVLSMDIFDGLIGNRLLKRFDIIFNYGRQRIYLEPNEQHDEAYTINYSGFNIIFINGAPFVKNVVDRSPADKAGLRDGDQIISIDAVLVENLSPSEIRDAFQQADVKVELVILRHNKYKFTEFKLKPLI